MNSTQIIVIAFAMMFGCAVQGAVGFGSGLFAIPLMIWAGVSLPSAIAISLVGIGIQCAWNLHRNRGQVTFHELIPIFTLRLVTLPIGIFLLGLLVSLGTARVKQVVGLMIVLALIMQWAFRVKPKEKVAYYWTLLAGTTSGIFAGLVGLGGPPVVLWVMAHDWPSKKSRAYLWATFLMLTPINLSLLVYRFPDQTLHALLIGLFLCPLMLIGSEIGLWTGGRMNRQRLRTAALSLLLILAVISVLGPIMG